MAQPGFLRTTRRPTTPWPSITPECFQAELADQPPYRALRARYAELGPVADFGCDPGHVTAHVHALGLTAPAESWTLRHFSDYSQDEALISQVRRFNRVMTQQVGALNDRFLARDRPLGEARLLWEIGAGGRDVRSLRTDLDPDSGYLSRLLRSLEAAGLVTVGTKDSDRRVRMARLTRAGNAERSILDSQSDELAASLLEHLSEKQRTRLVDAMAEIERLLTAAMVSVVPLDPAHPQAPPRPGLGRRHCLAPRRKFPVSRLMRCAVPS